MSKFKAGDKVRVLPPYDAAMPGTFTVRFIHANGCPLLDNGNPVHDDYLILVQRAQQKEED